MFMRRDRAIIQSRWGGSDHLGSVDKLGDGCSDIRNTIMRSTRSWGLFSSKTDFFHKGYRIYIRFERLYLLKGSDIFNQLLGK